VLATQNPIEQEGTYPCPKRSSTASCCRSTSATPTGTPSAASSSRPLGSEEQPPRRRHDAEALMNAQRLVRRLPVGDSVVEAILDLVRTARPAKAAATSPTS
jgi:MoxR-like ATPase